MLKPNKKTVMISAGEASGDLLASRLIQDYQQLDSSVHFLGMGGQQAQTAGMEIFQSIDGMNVMGLVEILKHLPRLRSVLKRMKQAVLDVKPDVLILIDYPEFNLRLAKFAHQHGIKVLYYVSPQVWAWRKGRIKHIKHCVDHMAVLFPFEAHYYQEVGVPVTFVGHPLCEQIPTSIALQADAPKILCLMPGSREQEIKTLLPVMLETAQLLRENIPELQVQLIQAPGVDLKAYQKNLEALDIACIQSNRREAMAQAQAILVTSGTATLECALLGKPTFIVYRMAKLSHAIAKRLIKLPYIGLCNLVAGKKIAEEFLQEQANAEQLKQAILPYLQDPEALESMRRTWDQALNEFRKASLNAGLSQVIQQFLD